MAKKNLATKILDKDKTVVEGPADKIDTKEVRKRTKDVEYKANKKMFDVDRGKREISKRSGDILKTADVAIDRGDEKKLRSLAKAAHAAGDTDTLSKLVNKLRKSKVMKKAVNSLAGALPMVGAAAAALQSGDASAAIPGLDVESIGKGSEISELPTKEEAAAREAAAAKVFERYRTQRKKR